MTSTTTLLVDADMLVYQLAWTVDAGTTRRTLSMRVGWSIDDMLMAVPDELVRPELFLTAGAMNFRNKIAVTVPYKGNREGLEKPFHYDMIRDIMVTEFNAVIETEQEADDAVAIRATRSPLDIIASADKDLLTVPGRHLRLKPKGKHEYTEVSETEALLNFYQQMLTGDSGDNIIGIYGMGPKKARKIMDDVTDEHILYGLVVGAYTTHYAQFTAPDIEPVDLAVSRINENGQLLHMRRTEGELWVPPGERS